MRKSMAMVFAAITVGLCGCTPENMDDGIYKLCEFRANNQDIIKLATKLGGTIVPGAVFAVDTAETVVTSVCAAYKAQKEVKRESAIRGVTVKGVFIRKAE